VDVVALHRERDDTEGIARRLRQRGSHDGIDGRRTQRRRQLRGSERHVRRGVAIVVRAHAVGYVGPRAACLATGAVPPTAVLANDEHELSRARGHA
jgi:hypothetical protein